VSEKAATNWYEFACTYVDMKWKQASAKYRKDIARALTAATPAMLTNERGRPADADIRRALVRWGFNTKQRSEPPADVAEVLAWVARNSAPLPTLAEAATARRMLDRATGRLDGKNAAASTARRHRIILANAMDYAVELGLLETNPIRVLKWTAPKVSSQVDRRAVVNPRQARALLEAVRAQQPSGPRLVAFFAVMYYAGLRPEEAISLSRDSLTLPSHGRGDDDDWGELHIRSAAPDAGGEWTDDGSDRETRQLKHRAEGDSRIVPAHPELTRLLREHLDNFGTAPDGRLFGGVPGGELPTITYRRALDQGTPDGSEHCRASLAARAAPVRPPACLLVHMAERRRLPNPGGRMGWARRGRPPADLRQVRCGARTSSPSAGSAKRCGRTDMDAVSPSDLGLGHVLGTATCISPPTTAYSRTPG
jgi:integrase